MTDTFSFDGLRDELGGDETFTITDWTEDFALDCNTDTGTAVNNVLGTIVKALIKKGILRGSVTTT